MVREDGKHVGWIYCYTCVDESLKWYGWDYVGQTRDRNGVNKRDYNHRNKSHGKSNFERAYQKHPDAFTLDVVDEYVCDTEAELITKLNDMEQYYILLFGSFRDCGMGFNLTTGGGECVVCDDTRRKMSESHKKLLANPETRMKMSERMKKRYEDPDERRKQSEAQKKRYEDPDERRKTSEAGKKSQNRPEVKMKKSESLKGKNAKPCQLLDLESGFVMCFESWTNCAEFLQIDIGNLSKYKTKPCKKRWIFIQGEC